MGWRTFAIAALLVAPLAGAAGSAAQPSIPPFLLAFDADAPGALHDSATLGVAPDATSGYDRGQDVPKPPPPPGGPWIDAFVTEPSGEPLSRSLEGPGPTAGWTARVDAEGPAGTLLVAWNRSQLAAFPGTFTLNATYGNRTFDLRDEPTLAVQKGNGSASVSILVHIERMWGTVPGAPQGLQALPGPGLGQATLSWSPPASDGGHPVRLYTVYRADDGGPLRPLAHGNATAFTDSGLVLGSRYQYAVSATNRLGEGNLSGEALALGTGKPAILQPAPPGPGERDERVADVDAPLPSAGVWLPASDQPLLAIHGAPEVIDGREYDLSVTALGQTLPTLSVFTGVEVPIPIDLALPPVQGAQAPAGDAHVALDARYASGGWTPETLVLRTSAHAGDAGWDDATALP